MATRTIEDPKDRLTTILVAPLMTCSARLPVYAIIIGPSFHETMVGPFNLQGLVLFALYALGVISAVAVAFVLKRTATKGPSQPLIMELPTYKLPVWRDFFLGLGLEGLGVPQARRHDHLRHDGRALWVLAYFPNGGTGLEGSYAGMIGRVIEPIFKPIGFNLEMVVALIPGMAAREAAVSSLGLIYSLGPVDETSQGPPDHARLRLDPADGSQLHRLVRLRPTVLCDSRHRAPRDQFVAMDGLHVRLSDRTGVCRINGHLLDRDLVRALIQILALN
jgi:ferrous iron transport protein B